MTQPRPRLPVAPGDWLRRAARFPRRLEERQRLVRFIGGDRSVQHAQPQFPQPRLIAAERVGKQPVGQLSCAWLFTSGLLSSNSACVGTAVTGRWQPLFPKQCLLSLGRPRICSFVASLVGQSSRCVVASSGPPQHGHRTPCRRVRAPTHDQRTLHVPHLPCVIRSPGLRCTVNLMFAFP